MKTVILTTFYNNVQAHMLQDLLRNEGIESMLQGELSAQVIASYIPGLGIQVLVFEKDYERAREIKHRETVSRAGERELCANGAEYRPCVEVVSG